MPILWMALGVSITVFAMVFINTPTPAPGPGQEGPVRINASDRVSETTIGKPDGSVLARPETYPKPTSVPTPVTANCERQVDTQFPVPAATQPTTSVRAGPTVPADSRPLPMARPDAEPTRNRERSFSLARGRAAFTVIGTEHAISGLEADIETVRKRQPSGAKGGPRPMLAEISLPSKLKGNPSIKWQAMYMPGQQATGTARPCVLYGPWFNRPASSVASDDLLLDLITTTPAVVISPTIHSDQAWRNDKNNFYSNARSGWFDEAFEAQRELYKKINCTLKGRIWGFGDSAGATYIQQLSVHRPERFAGVVCYGGGGFDFNAAHAVPSLFMYTYGDKSVPEAILLAEQSRTGGGWCAVVQSEPLWEVRGGVHFNHTAGLEGRRLVLRMLSSGVQSGTFPGKAPPPTHAGPLRLPSSASFTFAVSDTMSGTMSQIAPSWGKSCNFGLSESNRQPAWEGSYLVDGILAVAKEGNFPALSTITGAPDGESSKRVFVLFDQCRIAQPAIAYTLLQLADLAHIQVIGAFVKPDASLPGIIRALGDNELVVLADTDGTMDLDAMPASILALTTRDVSADGIAGCGLRLVVDRNRVDQEEYLGSAVSALADLLRGRMRSF